MRGTLESRPVLRPLLAGLIVLLAHAASSRAHAAGVNLGVETCGPGAGNAVTFACDRNDGADVFVGSFKAPFAVPKLLGIQAGIMICHPSYSLPDWWRLVVPGNCRATSATADFIMPAGSCEDYWSTAGGAVGGVVGFYPGTNGVMFWITATVDSAHAGPIVAGHEYFLFRLTIDHARSTGAGACAGCTEPANITFAGLSLSRLGDYDIGFGYPDRGRTVAWQGGSNCEALPVRNRTWGAIKSLYR